MPLKAKRLNQEVISKNKSTSEKHKKTIAKSRVEVDLVSGNLRSVELILEAKSYSWRFSIMFDFL